MEDAVREWTNNRVKSRLIDHISIIVTIIIELYNKEKTIINWTTRFI